MCEIGIAVALAADHPAHARGIFMKQPQTHKNDARGKTCAMLVERYHRAFDEELPRLERLAQRVARSLEAASPAACFLPLLVELKREVSRHTEAAEIAVHRALGSPDGAGLLHEHLQHQVFIRALVKQLRSALAELANAHVPRTDVRVARALVDGVETLDRTLAEFFAREIALEVGEAISDAAREPAPLVAAPAPAPAAIGAAP
jgi:iron-sulfur cluster repair protein YtfE (RIC family)